MRLKNLAKKLRSFFHSNSVRYDDKMLSRALKEHNIKQYSLKEKQGNEIFLSLPNG